MGEYRYRPDLPQYYEQFIDKLRDLSESEVNALFSDGDFNEKTEVREDENGIHIRYLGGKPITSKEQAIEFFEIDTKKYEVVGFQCKSWTTTMKIKKELEDGKTVEEPVQAINYGVTLVLKKKPTELKIDYKVKPRKIKTVNGKLNCIVPLADFHIGAYVGELLKTKDFNFNVICSYLNEIAESINKDGYANVHLMMLGDFIESFTGLNHINTWKGLHKGSYGMGAVILAHEVLSEHLFSKINNLKTVDFVSGNHDRITSNNNEDVQGEVGKMLHYLFKKDFKDIESEYSDLLIRREIDGIGYLGTHGHLGLSKKDTGKIVQDYGFQNAKYHVVVQGHTHAREVKKHFKKIIAKYEDVSVVQHDSLDYRRIVVPPLFTGNFYSESLGFTSTAGFTKIWKNEYGQLNHLDITI